MSQELEDLDIKKEDPSMSSSECFSEMGHTCGISRPFSHYGAVSDKIGEATACWLARWGPDILPLEETSGVSMPSLDRDAQRPVIWARGGLNSKWIKALVSSDALFVKGERERYEFAKSVVDLRRRSRIDEEEEEWTEMFSNGIYYANMVYLVCLLFYSST
jgi:hypothetical protein